MYALVDCNNFFVSCERVFRPELERKAVVVLSNNDGCVVARSNESKAMGIKMGTPFFQLKTMVDSGRLIACSSNYSLYGDLSSRVMSILASSVEKIEIYSIDEAFLHLDGFREDQIPDFCRSLVRKIRKWVGIPVSIGVAPTKTLAKVASHFAKKYPGYRGVCMIDSDEKREKALRLTPIADVWGVGRRLAPRLEAMAVKTAFDFVSRPKEWVLREFNVVTYRTWAELRGEPAIGVEDNEARKSICTSRSFAEMITDEKELALRVSDFAAKCAQKLREEGTAAYEITSFLYTNRFRDDLAQYYPTTTIRLSVAVNNTQEIVAAALKAMRFSYRPGFKYKKAGVVVSDIVPADSVQGDLFDEGAAAREKADKLSRIMDTVNAAASADGLLRLATQREGHYTDGIRHEHCSRCYSTVLSDIIDIH